MDVVRTSLREELKTKGSVLVPIHGVSMLPMLRQKTDCVVVENATFEDLKPMDVVLYYDPVRDMYILHRLLWKENHAAKILGDNCVTIETVPEDKIRGRMSEFFRGEKDIKTTDAGYRMYVVLWARPWKFRIFLLKCRNKALHVGSKLKRMIQRGDRK